MRIRLVPIALIAIATPFNLSAQQTATNRLLLIPAEYGRWERLLDPALSPNGEWVAVPVTRVERTSEIRVYRVRAGADTPPFVATEGRDPVFTDDARWLAYAIGQSEAERTRLEKEKKPVPDGAGPAKLQNR